MIIRFDARAAVIAGLIAGLVFMMLEMVLVGTIGGGSPWGPPRMIAAIGMGREVLPLPATFDPGVFVVALIIHFLLSILLALIFAGVAAALNRDRGMTVLAAIVLGLVVYVVSFHVMTGVFPWFAGARNGITILAHAVFGGVLGWAYYNLAKQPSRAVPSVHGARRLR